VAGGGSASSRSAEGTKNRLPETAVEKSRMRSVLPGGVADEHVLQHLLDHLGATGIADEVRAEDAVAGRSERHVVPDDLALGSVRVHDRVQSDVRVGRLIHIGQFDVVQLGPADDPFLLADRERVPPSRSWTYF
jgi:hypothetical protein